MTNHKVTLTEYPRSLVTSWARMNAQESYNKSVSIGNSLFSSLEEAISHAEYHANEMIQLAERKIHPLLDRQIKTADIPHKAIRYLYWFLEECYHRYTFEFPEDHQMKKEWESVKHQLAILNYNRDSTIYSKITSFVDTLMTQLKKCRIYPTDYNQDLQILSALKPSIDNPDINDVPLYSLGNRSDIYIPVVDLQEALQVSLRKFIEEMRWGILKIKKNITPFINIEFNQTPTIVSSDGENSELPTATDLIQFLDKILETQHPLLLSLINKSIYEHNTTHTVLESIDTFISDQKGTIFFDMEQSIFLFEKKLNDEIRILNEISELFKDKEFNYKPELDRDSVQKKTKILEWLKVLQDCHFIYEFFITNPISNCIWISSNIKIWIDDYQLKYKNPKLRTKVLKKGTDNIDSLIKQRLSSNVSRSLSSQPTRTSDINTLVREINQARSAAPKKTKKRKKPSKTGKALPSSPAPTSVSLIQPAPSTPSISSTISAPPIHTITIFEQAIGQVKALQHLLPSEHSEMRNSLLNARLHLLDLDSIHKRIQTPHEDLSRLYNSALAHCFYSIEQILQYKNLSQNGINAKIHNHSLRQLLCNSNLETHLNSPIISKIDRSHVWVAYPYFQLHRWKELTIRTSVEIPSTLSLLTNEGKSFNNRAEEVLREIDSIYRETIQFILQLTKKKKKKALTAPPVPQQVQIPVNSLHSIHRQESREWTQKLENEHSAKRLFEFSPENIRLEQAKRGLSYFHQTIDAFETSTTISSTEFSCFVRDSIYWFNNFLDNYLHAKHIAQYMKTEYKHDIAQLLETVVPSANPIDLEFLKTRFTYINNDVRYPYNQYPNHSIAHRLIHDAQHIRENPSIIEGYSCSSSSASVSPKLPAEITEQLSQLFEQTCLILKKYF